MGSEMVGLTLIKTIAVILVVLMDMMIHIVVTGGMMIIVIHTIVVDTTEILSGVHQEGPKKNTRREEEGPVQSCEAALGTVTGTVTATEIVTTVTEYVTMTGVVIEIDNENMIVHVNVIEIVEEGEEVGHAHRLDLVLVANLAVVVTTAATIALMNIV